LTVKRFSSKGKKIDGGDSGESRSKLSGKGKFLTLEKMEKAITSLSKNLKNLVKD